MAGAGARISAPSDARRFTLAGDAYVTLVSVKTGVRFTYHVRQADARPGDTRPAPHFVSVLTAPEHYEYLGAIFGGEAFRHGRDKARIGPDAPSARAFAWAWPHLAQGREAPGCEVWHEGRCGKCGRRLTTPISISMGIGPICAQGGRDA